jgi:hypothetical protein
MNWKRIVLGGLAAGLVINISEFLLNAVVIADAMEADMARYELTFAAWAMVAYVLMAFSWGLFLAWCYAAIRPRFGPGPKTALIAAAVLWFLAYLTPTLHVLAIGMGGSTYGMSLLWGAVEVILAAQVAGWLYREEEGTRHRAAAY